MPPKKKGDTPASSARARLSPNSLRSRARGPSTVQKNARPDCSHKVNDVAKSQTQGEK